MSTHTPDPLESDDDDALSWAGDDARGRDVPRLGDGSIRTEPEHDAAPDEPGETRTPRSAGDIALAIMTVLFALAYLAVTVGWVLSAQNLGYPGLDLPGEIMWQFGEFLALIAAGLWFAAVLALTPAGASWRGAKRAVWFTLGLAVLLPWPYLLGALG